MAQKVLLEGKLLHPSNYLAAVEFQGRDVTLTIQSVQREELALAKGGKEMKPTITFRETPKKLVVNKTNADSIAQLYGHVADEWAGKRVTLYPARTLVGRDEVDCIRVRETVPPAATSNHDN